MTIDLTGGGAVGGVKAVTTALRALAPLQTAHALDALRRLAVLSVVGDCCCWLLLLVTFFDASFLFPNVIWLNE